MESELLEKEKEYYDLNNQLEFKTKQILEQVDNIFKTQGNLISKKEYDILSSKSTAEKQLPRSASNLKSYVDDNETGAPPGQSTVNINIKECKDLNLPPDVCTMGTKGLITFLKAKLKKLQMDYNKLNLDFQTKCVESKKFQTENQSLFEEKAKWLQSNAINKNLAHKLENQVNLLQTKLHTKEYENNNLKKEIEHLKKRIKTSEITNSNADTKLNRAFEDCQKMKLALKTAKQEEKEKKEFFKQEVEVLTCTIKKLEKQAFDFESGFKKQLLLINNLKKQKMHYENLSLGETVGKDFLKILEWNNENDE